MATVIRLRFRLALSAILPSGYLTDNSSNILTDASGNRLTY